MRRSLRTAAVVAAAAAVLGLALAGTAAAATYTATEAIPVPPASTYEGSGGGDGWAVALSSTQVFNVFHHQDYLGVACHLQSDAEPCEGWPKTITEPGTGAGFTSQPQPGLYLDQSDGRLYVYTTRLTDDTGGVVCVETTSTEADPFCGFTELTGKGEAPLTTSRGISGLSDPMLFEHAGQKYWYAFNFTEGTRSGDEDEMACFDLTTSHACSGQPYAVTLPEGTIETRNNEPIGETAAIAGDAIIPMNVSGQAWLTCFNTSTDQSCAGNWPVEIGGDYAYGAPFPMLSASGTTTGLCLPTGLDPCYNLEGGSVATPENLPAVVPATEEWDGPGLAIGSRVYVPNAFSPAGEAVDCFDYSTGEGCPNFPKAFSNLGLLYTVNADPQRPTCIWVNSDDGGGQIQNFDAYTGGACGKGVIRVLASHLITAAASCTPSSYSSLQVTSPSPNRYTSGYVTFEDSGGNPITGAGEVALNGSGVANLQGLNLNTGNGLPQFVITLVGAPENLGSVVVKLTWEQSGSSDPSCLNGGTYVALGDSYSSGQGTGVYLSGTAQKGDECHRSALSWPFDAELALAYYSQRFSFHACSGAVIKDFTHADHAFPSEPPQLHWLAGAAGTKASLVSFTIGGNNAYFAEVIKACYLNSVGLNLVPCQTEYNGAVNSAITRMGTNSPGNTESLTQLYEKTAALAPNATILVVGYPRFFPPNPPLFCGTGSLGSQFERPQMQWMNNEVRSMDNTIARAVRETLDPKVRYLETYEAFRGHERCESEPWLNGVKATHNREESFHPNINGYSALARLVEKAAG